MSIRELLAVTPDGKPMAAPLSDEEIGKHLFERYLSSSKETTRRTDALHRRKLYTDNARDLMETFLFRVFDDSDNRKRYQKVIDEARYNNVIKRVTHELSTVYRLRARRNVEGPAENNEAYRRLQRKVRLNDLMRRVNRYLNLYRDVVLYFRVREVRSETDGRPAVREPVLEVIPPDRFYAVSAPHDPTQLVALIIDQKPSVFERGAKGGEIVTTGRKSVDGEVGETQALSHALQDLGPSQYLVLTDYEKFKIDERGRVLKDTWHTWKHLTRMPAILAHAEPPDGCLLDGTTGADLVAAHMSVWLQNVMLVKESKALSKQAAFSGDLSSTARGQAIDSEVDMHLQEGVSVQTIDRGLDPQHYMRVADHILDRVAANYGIPASVLRHEGATSGHEIELRRIGIRERREEQEETLRDVERDLAQIMAEVTDIDLPDYAFKADGWKIDFGDTQTPMSTKERLDVFKAERQMGLTSTIRFMQERNPDLTEDAAVAALVQHIAEEVQRNRLMRPLMQISGAMGAELPDTEIETVDDVRDEQPTTQE